MIRIRHQTRPARVGKPGIQHRHPLPCSLLLEMMKMDNSLSNKIVSLGSGILIFSNQKIISELTNLPSSD
jgi:hypothetical protein